jgi:hypothetical protein
VLHDGHDHDWPVSGCDPCVSNQATIGAVHGGSGIVTDVVIEKLVAETSVWRPVWLGIDKNTWSSQGGGRLMNWTLRDVRFAAGGQQSSSIMGATAGCRPADCSILNMRLRDFDLSGVVAHDPKSAHIDVTNACNVVFSATAQAVTVAHHDKA